MKKMFIGIDISKDVFDYCFLDETGSIIIKGQDSNDHKGILSFCSKVKSYKNTTPLVCMEHTGHYGYLLALILSQQSIQYSLLVPLDLKLSMGLKRGKNDSIDAYRIAYYAMTHQNKLVPYKLPSQELQQLKTLMAVRKRLSKIKVQIKNGLKGLQIVNKSIDVAKIIEDNEVLIKQTEANVQLLEKQMIEIIKSNEELYFNYKKITSVIGVGSITAIYCIIETVNFEKYTIARKFACNCGLAPFEYSSGSSIRGKARTSMLCNKDLKGILYKAASSAIQHDPQLKLYYNRKIKEGKHKLSVLNAVANKLILRIFAVQKREEYYLKLSA